MISGTYDALVQCIVVEYAENSDIPYLINGKIDLVTGDTEFPFLFVGAVRLTIQFHEKVLS